MNRRLSGLTLSLLALAVSGCSILPDSRKIDYKSSTKAVPTLEVPPDLSQVSRDERFLVPDAAGKGSATYSAYSADRTPLAQAQNSTVLPQVDKVRVERSGNSVGWLSRQRLINCGIPSRISGKKPGLSSISNARMRA